MTEHIWSEMAAAFALDALDTDEREAFEAQLRRDPELQDLVDQYRGVVGAMAAEVEQVAPPVLLRDRLVEQAASTRAEPPAAPREATTPRTRRGGKLLMAASVVLAVAAGAWAVQLNERAGGLEDQVATLTGELATLRAELESAEPQLAAFDSIAATFVGSDLRFASLTSPDTDPRLHLVLNPDENLLLVAATNLPPAEVDRVYQLWGIREGEDPVSLGTFDSSVDNTALLTLPVGVGPDFEVAAITDEPLGGSPLPTTTPFLVGAWTGSAG